MIARNSSFAYKGKAVDVRAGGPRARRALRARRQRAQGRQSRAHHRAADRRRDGQPCLGGTLRPRPGRHLRSAGRDHGNVVGAIEPELGKAERERARAKRPDDLRAWDSISAACGTPTGGPKRISPRRSFFSAGRSRSIPAWHAPTPAAEEACFFQIIGGYVDSGDCKGRSPAVRRDGRAESTARTRSTAMRWGGHSPSCARHDAAVFELGKAIELSRVLPKPTTRSAWRSSPVDARRKRCRT